VGTMLLDFAAILTKCGHKINNDILLQSFKCTCIRLARCFIPGGNGSY